LSIILIINYFDYQVKIFFIHLLMLIVYLLSCSYICSRIWNFSTISEQKEKKKKNARKMYLNVMKNIRFI